jgi:hypothetical protein
LLVGGRYDYYPDRLKDSFNMSKHAWQNRLVLGFTACIIAGSASAQGAGPAMAKMGANISGYNYENAATCDAPASFLLAYKTKKQRDFAAAGAEFEVQFAAGRADAASKWKNLVATIGEAKARSSVCVDGQMVAKMQSKLAKE